METISLDVPRVVPPSPTAITMQKFQSYPVDHSTGLPNITIPLYEIVAGEVTIPVTISYHSSGLKPKDGSTLVGTGWILNLEPSISREVKGGDDLCTYGWLNDPRADYYPYDEDRKIQYYGELVDGIRDTQPDKYTYKLANGGGAGYFYDKYTFLTIPRNNDRVELRNGLTITDPNGVKYLFSGPCEVNEIDDVNWVCNSVITRWMCSSIQSARNPDITLVDFSYRTTPNVFGPGNFDNLNNKVIINISSRGNNIKNTLTEQRTNNNRHYRISRNEEMGPGIRDAVLTSISEWESGTHYPIIKRNISDRFTRVELMDVNFFGNKLSIYYTSVGNVPHNSTVIDRIEVTGKNREIVRNIKFHITPYNSNTSLTKLDSVVITAPGVEPRKYAFSYYAQSSVPSVYTFAVDHWGFCNGSNSLQEPTVPGLKRVMTFPDVNGGSSWTAMVNYAGANREPNHEWTKRGILNQIINPQGIVTTFEYEGNHGAFRDNNRYYGNKNYLHPVGGLRVKRILNHDPKTNRRITTDYQYGLTKHEVNGYDPVWGGGAIKHIVSERDYRSNEVNRRRNPDNHDVTTERLTVYSSMPVSNISFNGGSPVYYNIVKEKVSSSVDNNRREIIYRYDVNTHKFEDILEWEDTNPVESVQTFLREQPEGIVSQIARRFPSHPLEPSGDFVNFYAATNQLHGSLISKEYYGNSILTSVHKNYYEKIIIPNNNLSIDIPYRLIKGDTENMTVLDVYLWGNYNPESNKPQTTYYLDCGTYKALAREVTTNYYYTGGRQDSIATEKRYTYREIGFNPGVSLSPRRVETINSDNTLIIDSLDYLLDYPAILSRQKQIVNDNWTESRILFRSNTCLPDRVQSRTNRMETFRDEVRYNAYDNYGNVTEIMGKDGIPTSILWGYNGRFPVAKIENATIEEVYQGSAVFEEWSHYAEPPFAMWSKISMLRNELQNAKITTYEYNPLQGVVSITDPNNITTKFEYDNYNRLTDNYFLDPVDLQRVMLQKYIYNFGK